MGVGIFEALFDKTFLVTMAVGILAFATIATLVLPMMDKGGLDDRLKSVAKRREELRARHHAQLNAKRGSLRVEPSSMMKSVLDRFKLGTALESENSRDKKVLLRRRPVNTHQHAGSNSIPPQGGPCGGISFARPGSRRWACADPVKSHSPHNSPWHARFRRRGGHGRGEGEDSK